MSRQLKQPEQLPGFPTEFAAEWPERAGENANSFSRIV
jgi:hypothetical protein